MAMLLPFSNVCPSSVSVIPFAVTSLRVSSNQVDTRLRTHYSLTFCNTMSLISSDSS